jgi:hypothetical protein
MSILSILFQEVGNLSPLATLGVGGGIAALVLTLWRQDKKDSDERYAALAKESNERAAAIAADFRAIVQENTKAVTLLVGKLEGIGEQAKIVELLTEVVKQRKPVNVE